MVTEFVILLFSHLSFTASHSKYTKQRSITTKTRSKISRFQVRNDQHVCVHLPQSVLCWLSSLLQTFLSFFPQYVCCAQKKLDSRSIMMLVAFQRWLTWSELVDHLNFCLFKRLCVFCWRNRNVLLKFGLNQQILIKFRL